MLLPFAFTSVADATNRLLDLAKEADVAADLALIASRSWNDFEAGSALPFVLVLVAKDVVELRREIKMIQATARTTFDVGRDCRTPNGSVFAVQPMGKLGRVAFVYPGIGSLYAGCLKGLDRLWGRALSTLPRVTEPEIQTLLHPDVLWPSMDQVDAANHIITTDIVTQAEMSVSLCYVLTHFLRSELGLISTIGIGNSLGELSMFSSGGVWLRPQELAARMRASEIFPQRISGPLTAVRSVWGSDADWASYLIKAPLERVEQAMKSAGRVRLTHINTPDEVVVGGDPPDVERLLAVLGGNGQRLPFQLAYHTDMVDPSAAELEDLYRLDLDQRPSIDFASMSPFTRIPHDQRMISRTLVNTATKPVDFPQIVHTAWGLGARVFVEIGARQNCATWIRSILANESHLAVSVDQKGTDASASMARLCATLLSHGVPLNRVAVRSLFGDLGAV